MRTDTTPSQQLDEHNPTGEVSALSPTAMHLWETCPKQFHFIQVLRLPRSHTYEQALGVFVHGVLERLADLPGPIRTVDSARRTATGLWNSGEWKTDEFADLHLTAENEHRMKRSAWARLLTALTVLDYPSLEVVATELRLVAEKDGVPVRGVIDLITAEDDGLVVTDYKSGSAPTFEDALVAKFKQLATYAWMAETDYGPVSRLRLLFLQDGTVSEQVVDDNTVNSARNQALRIWSEVRDAITADVWPVRPQRMCIWCPCLEMCPFHNP